MRTGLLVALWLGAGCASGKKPGAGPADGPVDTDDTDDPHPTDSADGTVEPCANGSLTSASGMDFVTFCASTFDVGCTPGQSGCFGDERPAQTVSLTRDILVGRTEVTQAQYELLMGDDPSALAGCPACPAENISWHEAAALSNAMSSAEGLPSCYSCTGTGTGVTCTAPADPYGCEGYRLPTEAEWEGAARCGEDLLYAGSGASLDAVGWYDENSRTTPHPVASKAANACGLFDMSGNVWEWVNDGYRAYSSGALVDPVGPTSGGDRGRRGGSWSSDARSARVAFRMTSAASYRSADLGVRLVRTAP
jgi:formylglycine-generating enzyme required for sulfatase activity